MKFRPGYVFIVLCVLFLLYSFSIYLAPLSVKDNGTFDKAKATRGRLVWQENNCQSCHQLYSLGGYLGPDLTNIISKPNKGEALVKAMVQSGVKQMPAFNMNQTELDELIEFLKSVDASGTADPRDFKRDNYGMIDRK